MALFPHWFSTIFGIYYFTGCMVFFLAVTILIYDILKLLKVVTTLPTIEHLHDLSKLFYGFIIFGHTFHFHSTF